MPHPSSKRRTGPLAGLLIWTFVSLTGSSPLPAADRWILLEGPHLEAVSNAGEERTRRVVERLESFRRVILGLFGLPDRERLQVTVFVFRNDETFLPYKPLYRGDPASVSGFFSRGTDRNIIALDAGSQWDPLKLIQHEYLHLMASYLHHPWPLWLSEGMAEFYSTFRSSSRQATLGDSIPGHFEMIRQRGLYPMEALLGFDRTSSVYNEETKQGVFYAQSWLVVHYLMMGEGGRHRAGFMGFLDLLEQGVEPREAFPLAFPDLSLQQLEENLRRYARRPGLRVIRHPLEGDAPAHDLRIRPLTESAALAHLGDLLLEVGRLEEAARHYEQAMELDPGSPHPREGLALLAWHRGEEEGARSHMEAALALGSRSPRLHARWAENRMRELGLLEGRRPALAARELEAIRTSVDESIRWAPAFDRAHYLLATFSLRTGKGLERGLEAIWTAIDLAPQNPYYRITLADLQLETGDHAAAEKTLRELLASDDAGIRRHAGVRLEYLGRLGRRDGRTR